MPFSQGGHGFKWTGTPFRVASCWRGTLHGHPFTLTGYGNAEAMTGAVVQYRGHTTRVMLGSSGGPIVAGFGGESVCCLPNPAQGYPSDINITHADPPIVHGLKRAYPLEYGVNRTYP